uniref:Uncharacterized protein n=1 Tax=Coturnix japonica TaxID=93934 RepID=A0A8C2T5Y3_COTJA
INVPSPCRPQVTVLYFARSAELAGLRSESVCVPQRITSLQLWEEIVKIHPSAECIRISIVLAVPKSSFMLSTSVLKLKGYERKKKK